ncbi:MAG: Crp/Fnr family transcriptional regulator [Ekhidna sp.]
MVNNFKLFIRKIVSISDQEFDETLKFFNEKKLKKGDYFVKQGEVCQHIAYISEGLLRTYYFNDKSEEITSCFCVKNAMTSSYKSFINQEPSKLSIQALEDTQLLIIDHKHLQILYSKSTIWQQIGRMLSEQEYIVIEHYASVLNNETAKEKYLRLLQEQPHVIQKAKVEDIASYLGVTRRTLSRIRQEITTGV